MTNPVVFFKLVKDKPTRNKLKWAALLLVAANEIRGVLVVVGVTKALGWW